MFIPGHRVSLLLFSVTCLMLLLAMPAKAGIGGSSGGVVGSGESDGSFSLLQQLPGYWHGEAIETPVGPINYDMLFHRCGDGVIAGVAKTGASSHYWKFMAEPEPVRLRFMSTFRGNRQPIQLLSKPSDPSSGQLAENGELQFYAPEVNLLTLAISLSAATSDIRIFHYGKPHVHIRLSRAGEIPKRLAPHHSLENSCRGYPLDVQ